MPTTTETLPAGMVAPPTLDGVHLERAPSSTTLRTIDVRSVHETAAGGRREQRSWWGEAALSNPGCLLPLRRFRHEIAVDYANLHDERVEERLALPGPHELAIWKPVTLTYAGDGQTREMWMPWRLAADVVTLPPGLTADHVGARPRVKLGFDGDPFAEVAQDAAAYAAGNPAAGEVWFLTGGQKFKLDAAPAAGELVVARVMPLLRVLDETDTPRQYTRDRLFAEPRSLLLREV